MNFTMAVRRDTSPEKYALAWFEKAAAQGHVAAQEHLDDMQKYKMTQSRYDELQKELDCCRPQPMVWAAGNVDILA